MRQYCSYEFYTDEYGGALSSEEQFNHSLIHAQAVIDKMTFNRLKRCEDVPVEVKFAVCAAVDSYTRHVLNDGKVVASETVGKHSVTYASNPSSSKTIDVQMWDDAMRFLAGSKLLYRGVYIHE